MKTKLVIFGAGKNAEKILDCIKPEVEVAALIDNDSSKWGTKFLGKQVIAPSYMAREEFDFVVIAIPNYKVACRQVLGYGISRDKIIAPFAFDHKKYGAWRDIFYTEELIYLEMNQKLEKMNAYVSNLEYELAAKIRDNKIRYPIIRSWEQAVQEIINCGKSMSRFGDGEFDLMMGKNNCFQQCDTKLAERLQEVLKSNLENHIVAIPDAYGDFENRTDEFINCFRSHFSYGRREQEYQMIDMEKEYFDSFITRPYKDYIDKSDAGRRFVSVKAMWKDRDITIVEGAKTRLGVGNDLFQGAKSCIRVLGPSRDAFSKYSQILQAVLKSSKERLVLVAMGPTATVLSYDLAKCGYQALDIGHIDIEYEWYLRGVQEKIAIDGKYVSEVPGGNNVPDHIGDGRYNQEIVEIIK